MNPFRTPRSTSRKRKRGRSMTRTPSVRRSTSRRIGRSRKRGGYAPSVGQSSVDALMDIVQSPSPSGVARAASTYKKGMDMRRAAEKIIRSTYISGKNAGKLTLRPKKKSLQQTIAKKGITNNFEYRKSFAAPEAIAIGHTTLPTKITMHNLMRALLKYTISRMNMQVQDFGRLAVGNGFAVGDKFSLAYYSNDDINTIAYMDSTLTNQSTFDIIATEWTLGIIGNANRTQLRFESVRVAGSKGNLNINLANAKISGYTKSILKVQNVTSETAADNESDDVNAVPLQGKIYGCKGNNFQKKQNNAVLNGAFTVGNEEAIVGLYSKQDGDLFGLVPGQNLEGYNYDGGPIDNQETTFYKPSEPPKQWEVKNCYSVGSVSLDPGDIKESHLKQYFKMSFQFFYGLLVQRDQIASTTIRYNNDQGKCNVMYLEKTVGRPSTTENNITIWTQLEFTQSIQVHVRGSNYTAPIQYQRNW